MKINTIEISGWMGAIGGMRHAMQSYDKCDSGYDKFGTFVIGENDMKLCKQLVSAGSCHPKFRRMIHVQANVDMPRYLWSQLDTYHFNTKNSQSTMHTLLNNNNPITADMFVTCEEDKDMWDVVIGRLEELRIEFKKLQKSDAPDKKEQMNRLLIRAKRLLPEGFLQMRMFDTNYEELSTIYHQRKNHRLGEEWGIFCRWVETLPYAKELIIGDEVNNE